MTRANSSGVHPTAVVGPDVIVEEGVRIGPYAVVDGPVVIGAGTVIGPYVHLLGPLTIGRNNQIGTGCVLGGAPQHLGYRGEATQIIIGDDNVFREHVTVHRALAAGTGAGSGLTRIGHRNLFMVGSHVAHDCTIGNDCILANGALLAGHVTLADRVLISGNCAVHQYCRVGRLALLSGVSAVSQDIPPFWIMQRHNEVCGVNVIGMRRAGLSTAEIQAVRRLFAWIYRQRLPLPQVLEQAAPLAADYPAVHEVVEFIRSSSRGIPGAHRYRGSSDEQTDASRPAA
ncbi:MAG: acyl-ACP--UDP-N-acetylglucosamine O-acyltransferase [Gemmataceae bacterium]|nr:acyl-ACP--UDP-N-acetylglucosamine O-acyltransferase [Gemmataceae bacterium]MDW8242538.1 acyl-ACP--UDP-N-acetylglucosamine O-acyltransferase [Thermogemmata sp.]